MLKHESAQGSVEDVYAEEKKTEETLRTSENYLKAILNSIFTGVVVVDEKTHEIVDANPNALEAIGASKEHVIGKVCHRFICPAEKGKCPISDLGQTVDKSERVLLSANGEKIPIIKTVTTTTWRGRKYLVESFLDITERKQMEEKLRQYSERLEELVQKRTEELLESEKRYSVLVEEASDGVTIVQDGQIVFVNKKASEIAGYSRDELIGLSLEKLVDEKYHQLVKERYMRRMRGETIPATYEVEFIAKTSERVPVEVSATCIRYQGRPADLTIVRDITERKRMAEERLRLEKLAAIGELATMVGHDLRNPLQSIENAIYYLKNECAPKLPVSIPQKAKDMFQTISDSVDYADKIIRDLQDFSAIKTPRLEKTDINATIKETLSRVHIPNNIELHTELGYLPEIHVDKDEIKRVFMNLTTNGIQAMENGGTLTVATKKKEGFVEVSFKDTGIGISKENMEKLFTPFFTTKAKGMGVGLAICKKFVESHDGTIHLESEVGKGTTFTVKLPIRHETEVENVARE